MSKRNDGAVFSEFQFATLTIIGIAFIALIWKIIPLDSALKIILLCFGGLALLYLVGLFAENLQVYIHNISKWSAVVLTAIVFLLIPSVLHIVHMSHREVYLTTPPANGVVYAKITANIDWIDGKGSVGNEWSYSHYFNRSLFESGDIISVGYDESFIITSRIIEHDGISDIGEAKSRTHKFSQNSSMNGITITQNVKVVENGGKRYAGSYATFRVTYTLERAIPPNLGFYGILLSTNDRLDYAFSVCLIVAQIFSFIIITFITLGGSIKRKKIEEQLREKRLIEEKLRNERLEEEARVRKEKEKAEFINSLNGRSIREIAGVPAYIRYTNGLPVDNNDSTYGSFTVYISKNGQCYHEKRGCCSANIPFHIIRVGNRYRRCSKCCYSHFTPPQWHYNYISLLQEAKKHGINE